MGPTFWTSPTVCFDCPVNASPLFEPVPGNARDRQSDAVDIPGFGERGLLCARHAEFGTGDKQGAQVGPAKATTIGFVRTLSVAAPNIESRLLFNEVIVMALPIDHPNAQADHIDLRDFAGEDFVFTPQALGSGYHRQLIGLCEAAGFYPNVVQEATQLHTLMGLVASGFGVALVPESIVSPFLRDKVLFRKILPLAQSCNPGVGLYAGWHTDNESPLTGSFLSLLDFSDPQSVEGARAQAPERHGDQAVE